MKLTLLVLSLPLAAVLATPWDREAAGENEHDPGTALRYQRVTVDLADLSLRQYVEASSAVATILVRGVEHRFPASGTPYRAVHAEVLSTAKGSVPSRITLKVAGARSPTRVCHVPAAPEFAEGQIALVFLLAIDDGTWGVLGLKRGTYRVRDDGGLMRVRGHHADGEMPLEAFEHRIMGLAR